MTDNPWREKETLYELYIEQEMSMADVAEELGCGVKAIHKWLHRHDIKTRSRREAANVSDTYGVSHTEEYGEYRDNEEWLREKYWGEGLSQEEIADIVGCSRSAVGGWMKENGVMTFKPPYHRLSDSNGYERIDTQIDDDAYCVKIHRLQAVAEYGFDEVKDMHVHHKNGFKIDNRLCNIEIKTPSDHISDHVSDAEHSDTGEFVSW